MDRALRRANGPALAFAHDAGHAALLVHLGSAVRQRPGQAMRVFERVEMESVRFVQGAEIALAVDALREFLAAHALPLHAQLVGHEALLVVEDAFVVEPVGQVDAAVRGVASNAVAFDTAADMVDGVQRQAVKLRTPVIACRIQQAALAERIAAEHEAAVAARGTMTHRFRFQQHHMFFAPFQQ